VAIALGSEATDIDFELAIGGSISGTVVDADTGLPIEPANVNIYHESGESVGFGLSFRSDDWKTETGLPTGNYFAVAEVDGYVEQVYGGGDCPIACKPTEGTPISVVAGQDTPGIDFAVVRGEAPENDRCEQALPVTSGTLLGTTKFASKDGSSTCDLTAGVEDVWYRYTATEDVTLAVDTCGELTESTTVVSIHPNCDSGDPPLVECSREDLTCSYGFTSSSVTREVGVGETVLIRVATSRGAPFTLNIDDGGGLSFAVGGVCPGEMTAELAGATPDGEVLLMSSPTLGGAVVPAGVCAGTELAVEDPTLLTKPTVDASGVLSVTRDVGAPLCGQYLEVVDLETCSATGAVQIPE